jgi:cytosol alanyl aminopeptidase
MGGWIRLLLAGALAGTSAGCRTSPAAGPPPVLGPAGAKSPSFQSAAPKGPSPAAAAEQPLFRLPADVHPTREAVELEVVPDRERFAGRVAVSLQLDRQRSDLFISARGLTLSDGTLELGAEVLPVAIQPDDARGAARLVLPRAIGPGAATLHLSFSGTYDVRLAGLYRVKVQDRSYAFTQLEPIDARRAFPCFDEPSFKIPWELAVTVRAEDTAVSNSPVLDEAPAASGLKRVRFQATRPLPSYLVVLAVGEFDVVAPPPIPPNEIRPRPLALRGVATKGRGPELAFALQSGAEMLVLLERWFGMEFPYQKLDYIAVPDFQFGAMENAGAITFAEDALLVDPAGASELQKKWVAVDLAHEMAHQWFGDLVTMAFWDDLWLNESFATFMEKDIVSAWNPGLAYDLGFLGRVQTAMAIDELASAQAIRPTIRSETDITASGDFALVYAKGAAVLAMVEQYLGKDAFRAAIRRYLEAHADGNATLADLLAALSAQKRGVDAALKSFVEQPGVPLIEGRMQCRSGKVLLEVRQSPSRPLGSEAPDARWTVPVCARAAGAAGSSCILLSGPAGTLPLRGKSCPQAVTLNPAAAGYYRWTLPPKQLAGLLSTRSHLDAKERLSLAVDLVAAFDAGGMDAAAAVSALDPFAADEEPAVSLIPISFLQDLRFDVVSPAVRPRVEAHAQSLYGPVLVKLGWEAKPGEPARIREFRGQLVSFLAVSAGAGDVLLRAGELGRAYLGSDGTLHPELVDANLVAPALAAAAVLGDAALLDVMVDRLEKSASSQVRYRLLVGLGSFREPSLAERARSLTLGPKLHVDERNSILLWQLRRPETHAGAFQWIGGHISELVSALPPYHLGVVIKEAAGCSAADAAALEGLAGQVAGVAGGSYALRKSAEATRRCVALVAAQRPGADGFFKKTTVPLARE